MRFVLSLLVLAGVAVGFTPLQRPTRLLSTAVWMGKGSTKKRSKKKKGKLVQ